MRQVVARITLLETERGGRQTPLLVAVYSATAFFEGVAELSKHGYDFRMRPVDTQHSISPGETIEEVELAFLSAEEVIPHLKRGTIFSLWEGKKVGHGIVVRVDS